MPEGARIDVVIPAYQAERWLGGAIESVLAQTDAPLGQVLVVDNGSSDGTGAVARRYPAPVRCLVTGRTRSAHARNTGLAAVTAPYLALLDADDLMPPGSLAARFRALEAAPDLDGIAGLVLPFRDGQALPADCDAPALRRWTQQGQLAGNLLLRSAAARRIGPFDETLNGAEVPDWLVRAKEAGIRIGQLDRVSLLRRLHPDSLSQAATGKIRADFLKIVRGHLHRKDGGG